VNASYSWKGRLVVFVAVVIAACGDRNPVAPSPSSAVVSVLLDFVDADVGDMAQMGPNAGMGTNHREMSDYHFGSDELDRGEQVPPGTTVILHVHSLYYQLLDTALAIPDTITPYPGTGRRFYGVTIRLHRAVPAVAWVQYAAALSGPGTIRVKLLAPRGPASVRITNASFSFFACWVASAYCTPYFYHGASARGGPWRPDSTGWVTIAGPWNGWPDSLPPAGYGDGPGSKRLWGAGFWVDIEDDLGHKVSGGCVDGTLPGPPVDSNVCRTFAFPW
jgi:hypothetical protein